MHVFEIGGFQKFGDQAQQALTEKSATLAFLCLVDLGIAEQCCDM